MKNVQIHFDSTMNPEHYNHLTEDGDKGDEDQQDFYKCMGFELCTEMRQYLHV